MPRQHSGKSNPLRGFGARRAKIKKDAPPPPADYSLERLRAEPQWFRENCLKIMTKERGLQPFVLNLTQRIIVDKIAEMRALGIPPRIIVLKSRQVGVCLDPSTPVLTADLRWVSIDSVRAGDALLGIDEESPGGKGPSRKMRVSIVEASRSVFEPAIRIKTDRGEVVATPQHRWLVHRCGCLRWCETSSIKPGHRIRFLAEPWPDSSVEDGWFGGMIDGEGHLACPRKSGGANLTVTQLPGPVFERACAYLSARSYTHNRSGKGSGKSWGRTTSQVTMTRSDEIMRVVGQTRPTRYTTKPWWAGMELPGKRSGAKFATVISVEAVPRRRMIDLQTSTKTFIANGFVSHNSTLTESLLFQDCLLNPFRSSLVIADTEKHARGLFRMTRRFNRYLPEELRQIARLDNVGELEFPNESRMQVETEGDVISMTANSIHYSEAAFYKNPEATFDSSMQSLPDSVDSLALIESTANGQGNLYHSMWCAAVQKNSEQDVPDWQRGWIPIFVPWFKHEEYMHAPWFKPADTTQDERKLARRHGLNMRQLAWRRRTIATKCRGDEDVFKVWYPSTWQEAFAMSGRPVFPSDQLDYYAKDAPPIREQGSTWNNSPPSEVEFDREKKVSIIVPQPKGRLRIFEPWNPRHTYILFADPSEGDRQSDPSPIEVLDQMTLTQAAEWWGRVPPDVLAQFAGWLGLWYGGGMVNAEANNHGILFFSTLLDMRYPNIYFRSTHEESVAGEVTMKPGLMQTNKTKHAMFDTARRYVREKRGRIHSPILLSEMATAVYFKREGREATQITYPNGCHIDSAVCWAGALYTHRGSLEEPLLPLPENELQSAALAVALRAERDLEGSRKLAVDLTGMSGAELERLLDVRRERKLRTQTTGIGGER